MATLIRKARWLLLWLAAPVWSAAPANPVSDLAYGQALYDYYQGHTLQALTVLAVAEQQRQALPPLLENTLLETLLKLDYDLPLSAMQLMQQPDINTRLHKTDPLWLQLADTFYDRQLFHEAGQALAAVSRPQALADADLWRYLNGRLALRDGQRDIADRWLAQIHQPLPAAWLQLNIAVSDYHNGNGETAIARLEQAIASLDPEAGKEARQLQQHMRISAGFMQLAAGRPSAAASYFAGIPPDSLFADAAQLAEATAKVASQQPLAAARLWQTLQQHSDDDDARLSAVLELAGLLEQQGFYAPALDYWRRGEQLAQQRLQRLQQFHDTLASSDPRQLQTGLAQRRLMAEWRFLTDFFADATVAARFQRLQDLDDMREQLLQWQAQLPLLIELAEHKSRVYRLHAVELDKQKATLPLQQLQQRRDELANRLQAIRAGNDWLALNNSAENTQWQNLQAIAALLPQLQQDPFYPDYQQSLRRLQGVFLWQAAARYHERLWQADKALDELDKALAGQQQLLDTISQRIHQPPAFDRMQQSLAEKNIALAQQQQQIEQLSLQSLHQLQQDVAGLLQKHREQARRQLLASKLAIARVSEQLWSPGTNQPRGLP